jgi:hypothetical protein
MIDATIAKLITLAVVVKAVVITIATTALDVTFWKQVAIVAISAGITGAFGVVIALIASRDTRQTHDRLDQLERQTKDVAGAVGVTKRATDPVADEA